MLAHVNEIAITSFYRFIPLTAEGIANLKLKLETIAEAEDLRGLCLVGQEGINATVSATSARGLTQLKSEVNRALRVNDLHFKDSLGSKHPFREFKVKIKNEIVSLGKPGVFPDRPRNAHLTPQEWHAALRDPDAVVLDTRNDYEVKIGKFRGAIDLQLKEFNEFPAQVAAAGLGKDQRVLMYCTGGIRCEKAILEMREQGYTNVAQLEGGILNYLQSTLR